LLYPWDFSENGSGCARCLVIVVVVEVGWLGAVSDVGRFARSGYYWLFGKETSNVLEVFLLFFCPLLDALVNERSSLANPFLVAFGGQLKASFQRHEEYVSGIVGVHLRLCSVKKLYLRDNFVSGLVCCFVWIPPMYLLTAIFPHIVQGVSETEAYFSLPRIPGLFAGLFERIIILCEFNRVETPYKQTPPESRLILYAPVRSGDDSVIYPGSECGNYLQYQLAPSRRVLEPCFERIVQGVSLC
jgi:hypothetical protein